MAKTLTEIKSIARSHTRTAIRVLVGIMRSKDATPAARVSAANAILDRGWARPHSRWRAAMTVRSNSFIESSVSSDITMRLQTRWPNSIG